MIPFSGRKDEAKLSQGFLQGDDEHGPHPVNLVPKKSQSCSSHSAFPKLMKLTHFSIYFSSNCSNSLQLLTRPSNKLGVLKLTEHTEKEHGLCIACLQISEAHTWLILYS